MEKSATQSEPKNPQFIINPIRPLRAEWIPK